MTRSAAGLQGGREIPEGGWRASFDALDGDACHRSLKVTLLAQHRRMHYETLNARPAGERGA